MPLPQEHGRRGASCRTRDSHAASSRRQCIHKYACGSPSGARGGMSAGSQIFCICCPRSVGASAQRGTPQSGLLVGTRHITSSHLFIRLLSQPTGHSSGALFAGLAGHGWSHMDMAAPRSAKSECVALEHTAGRAPRPHVLGREAGVSSKPPLQSLGVCHDVVFTGGLRGCSARSTSRTSCTPGT